MRSPSAPLGAEPLVGERMSELVRVEVIETGLGGTTSQHLLDSARPHRTRPTEPQRRHGVMPMDTTNPEIAVDSRNGLRTDREDADPRTREPLARHSQRLVVEVTSSNRSPAIRTTSPRCR